MAQAKKDNNSVNTMLGTLQSDGVTPARIQANPSANSIMALDNTTGSDNSPGDDAKRDGNAVPVLLAVSETDGETPVQLYVDASGNLLIDST